MLSAKFVSEEKIKMWKS